MKVRVKLGVFAGAVALVFGAAFGAGTFAPDADPAGDRGVDLALPAGVSTAADGAVPALLLPGLAVADRGYALRVVDATPGAGEAVEVAFAIAGPDGAAVRDYLPTHEKEMHLIVVRRDLTGFQHLHPERREDGTWTAPANLAAAGTYRAFADFAPAALGGQVLTLGADLFVPGDFQPVEPPAPAATWTGGDYEVSLAGTPRAGAESELTFTVRRAGSPVGDLQPYLAAFGHLVALRTGDLAYLHTHPAQDAAAGQVGGPDVRFGTTFPTAGRYRLYLNFAHADAVRTAEFTVDVPAGALPAPTSAAPAAAPSSPQPASPASPPSGGGHGGH
ncbi:MAG: hypothetical protein ACT4QF_02840 [Sporichthyaceae bacterium]